MNLSRSRRVYASLLTGGLLTGGLLLAGAAVAPVAQAAPAAPCGGLISWSVLPASATGPDSRTLYTYQNIPAGATISDHVEVVNRSCQNVAFQIYLADASGTTAGGALTLLQAGQKSSDIGAWTNFPGHINELTIIVPGGKGVIEPFTITVPQNATPGDHTGGMIASVGVPHRASNGQMVTLFQRVAVPVELRVAGPLTASLRVENVTASLGTPLNPFGAGAVSVTYTVVNNGNVKLAGAQLVVASSGTFRPPLLPTILPGDSIRVTAAAGSFFPLGSMNVKVTVTPQWPARGTPLNAPLTAFTASTSLFAIPYALIVLLILLIGGGFGGWRFLRWRRRRNYATLAYVADQARQETERRLLGGGKS